MSKDNVAGQEEDTTVYTIRGIKKSLDKTIQDLANYHGKPKATLIREYLENYFSDYISQFEMESPLVSSFDAELADYLGVEVMKERYTNSHITAANHDFMKLLDISGEEKLRTILLNNAPYLRMRADQVCGGMRIIPRGLSLTFAMFAELASRDEDKIKQANDRIFGRLGQDRSERFYSHINAIRTKMNRLPVFPAITKRREGKHVTATVYQPEGYVSGAWKIHLLLKQDFQPLQAGYKFPALKERLFIPDQPYRKVVVEDGGEWGMGYCFVDGVCDLSVYSNGIPENENPVSLDAVMLALFECIDKPGGSHKSGV